MTPASLAVTIIVPMRNEERRIGRCLDSILDNDFDHSQLEILVLDGRSTDRSRTIVMEHAADCENIRILDNPLRNVSAALNIGIRNARGHIIIIMGAHAEYSRTYIKACLQELSASGADVVGGVLETRPGGQSNVAQAIALMSQHPFGVGGSAFRTRQKSGVVDTVPYGAYRREVFDKVGFFNEQLVRNQDFEFNARVSTAGGKIFLSPRINSCYYNVASLRALVLQAFNNGRWLPRMWVASLESFRLRHAVPAVFVGGLLLSIVSGFFHKPFFLPGAVAFALYSILVTISAGLIARRRAGRFFIPLIASFVVHHMAYGAGTLAGFFAWRMTLPGIPLEPRPTSTRL